MKILKYILAALLLMTAPFWYPFYIFHDLVLLMQAEFVDR